MKNKHVTEVLMGLNEFKLAGFDDLHPRVLTEVAEKDLRAIGNNIYKVLGGGQDYSKGLEKGQQCPSV